MASLDSFGGWPQILGTLTIGSDLSGEQTEAVLASILAGDATDAQISAYIVALRQKGETVDELTGMVRAMHAAATSLDMPENTIDIVGMGGAPSRRRAALNVSTMASIVAPAAGATVCKHGNRKASSTSGSFDLLEALGIQFDVAPTELEAMVEQLGICFAFARSFHPAMRHVGPVRMQLGIPTVFNALGPLAHPARLRRQLVGVADDALASKMIEVLAATGSEVAWVVTGDGVLDELSTTGPTTVRELRNGTMTTFTVDPVELGIARPAEGDLDGGDAAANKRILQRLVDGEVGAARDIVALNAAAGLVVGGVAADLPAGLSAAFDAIDSGAASAKLDALLAFASA
ncbi:MAG: anthranilate phosphoribosyltransferase [Acidimicrobiales bacterium]